MAIAVKSFAISANANGAASFNVASSESPSATSVGDLVIVIHGNDYYTLATLTAPTATGSPTITAITGANADGGTNEGHIKSYWYVANTGGTQTVTFNESGAHDEERGGAVLVLSGANTTTPVDGTASGTVAPGTTHNAPAISPAGSDSFAVVIDVTGGGAGGGGGAEYTMGSGVTEQGEFSVGAVWAGVVGVKQLSASGSTGTFTITLAGSLGGTMSTFGIATAAAAVSEIARPLPFPPFAAPFIHPTARPLQLQGDQTTAAVVAASGSLDFAGTAGASADVGTVAGSLTFSGSAGASVATVASGSLTFAGTAGASADAGSMAGSLTFAGTAGASGDAGTISGSITFAGTAVATAPAEADSYQAVPLWAPMFVQPTAATMQFRGDTSVGPVAATASGSLTLSGTAGASVDAGTVAGSLTFAGTAGASVAAAASGSLDFSGTAGASADVGTISGSLTFAGTAQVSGVADPYQAAPLPHPPFGPPFIGPQTVPVQLQGDRSSATAATVTGGSLAFSGTAGASADASITAGSLTLSGTVSAASLAQAAGSLALAGLVAAGVTVGTVTGSLTFAGAVTIPSAGLVGNVHGPGSSTLSGNVHGVTSPGLSGGIR